MNDDDDLSDLAGAVLDGEAVDWEAADVRATPADRALVGQLRLLADIAQAHFEDAPGTWGPLRLLERVGQGTFGEVYRAWDPRLDREVALKLLPAESAPAIPGASSIIEEGRLLARVRHPNVVTIHGAEQIADRIGLWMEYIDGRTLHDLVASDGRRFSPAEVEAIGRALCAAVGAVHDAGLLHRDITARNVMMATDSRVVLMDFGASRDRRSTRAELTGTPLYLAPEILAGGQPSVQSDVYSIGVLLYFLTTGSYPVGGATLEDLQAAHTRGERAPWTGAARRLPAPLLRVIDRALDPRPDRRFDATSAFAAELDGRPTQWAATGWTALALVLAAVVAFAWQGWPMPAAGRDGTEASIRQADTTGFGAETRSRAFRRAWVLAEAEGVIGPARAAEIFTDMIAADAAYAPAHAGLALADAYLSMNPYQGRSFAEVHAEMREAALTALRLDPALAEAHVARGWVHARELEWAPAERSFREAIRRDPLLLGAYTGITHAALIPLGLLDDAEQLLHQAMVHDPLASHIRLTLGRVLLHANRPADAIAVLEPARRTDSDLLPVDLHLGRSLALLKRFAEALPLLERRRQRLVDPNAGPEPWVAWVYVALDRRADAEALARSNDHLPFRRAIINGALGRVDRMYHGMEEMADREPQRLAHLLRAPELAAYRKDLRFLRLVQRLRLDGAAW